MIGPEAAPGLYEVDDAAWGKLAAELDLRQQRLVLSAVLFHSLVSPGRALTYNVHLGEDYRYPRLTDEGSLSGAFTQGTPLIGSFRARSLVEPASEFPNQVFGSTGQIIRDTNQRHLLLTPVGATDESVRRHWATGWQARFYDYLEERNPIALDLIRDHFWRRFERDRDRYHTPRDYGTELAEVRSRVAQPIQIPMPLGQTRVGARPAVIIGMHWLQAGGAERWALETVRIVREAGLLPIIITDRDSHQPWLTREDFDDALVLCLSHPIASLPADEPLLRALLEQFDVRGVLVHHCQWMYDRLPWIKLNRPQLEVVDSLHVLEFGGGFPRTAAAVSDQVSTHHVISGQLRDWLVTFQRISPAKVVLAPLDSLTIEESELSAPQHSAEAPLTLAFIGRMAKQKRPDSFLLLVRAAVRAGLELRVIIHGDGEMEGTIQRTISRYGLGDIVEIRTPAISVGKTLGEAHLLVVTSSNEGITLTTFEALAAGVPVVSTDVGAQSEVVPDDALLPRPVQQLVRKAIPVLRRLTNPVERADLLARERVAVAALAEHEGAGAWMKGVVDQWAK